VSLWYYSAQSNNETSKVISQTTFNKSNDLLIQKSTINTSIKQNITAIDNTINPDNVLASKSNFVKENTKKHIASSTTSISDNSNHLLIAKITSQTFGKGVNQSLASLLPQSHFIKLNTNEPINNELSSNNLVSKPNVKKKYDNYESEEEYFEIAENATDPVESNLIINKRQSLALSLGNTFGHGFSNKSGIFGNNILNSIGIEYSYQLKDRLLLGTGLFYKSKTGNGLSLNYNEENYGFGKTVTQTNVNISSLHYLEIPLFADFQIGQKHHLIGGLSFGYLMGVRNNVVENKTETLAGTQNSSSTEWGMKEYFNTIDVGLKIGYEYELSKKFKAGINAQLGLIDVTNKSKWNNSEKFNNQELQITLKYNFLQF